MRQGVFVAYFFGGVFLGCDFAEFQKMCDEGVLTKFAIASLLQTLLEYLEGSFGTWRPTDLIISAERIVPKHSCLFEGKKNNVRWPVLILPCSRSELDLKVAAANFTFCRWRRHEFSRRFADRKNLGTHVQLLDRRFTWNDRLFTSARIPSAKFWLGIFNSCHLVKVTEACNT